MKHLFIAILSALMFVGCSSDEEKILESLRPLGFYNMGNFLEKKTIGVDNFEWIVLEDDIIGNISDVIGKTYDSKGKIEIKDIRIFKLLNGCEIKGGYEYVWNDGDKICRYRFFPAMLEKGCYCCIYQIIFEDSKK